MATYDKSSLKAVLSWKLRRFLHKKTDAAGTAENLRDLLLDWIDDVEVDPPAPPGTSTATPTKTERKRKAPEKSEKEIHQQKLQENMAEIKAMDARFQSLLKGVMDLGFDDIESKYKGRIRYSIASIQDVIRDHAKAIKMGAAKTKQ